MKTPIYVISNKDGAQAAFTHMSLAEKSIKATYGGKARYFFEKWDEETTRVTITISERNDAHIRKLTGIDIKERKEMVYIRELILLSTFVPL